MISLEDGTYYGYGFQTEPEYSNGITLIHHGRNIVGVALIHRVYTRKKKKGQSCPT